MTKKSTGSKPDKKKKLPPGVRERDGRYTYRYSVEVVKDGKRTRKQKETESYPTAQAAYDAGILIKADQLKGKLVDAKNFTLEQWCERWLEDYKTEREARVRTYKSKRSALNSLKKQIGEFTKMKDISGDDYQKWLNKMRRDGCEKGTITEYHSAARMMFADAVRKKIIGESPADGAILPAFKLTLEQIESAGDELPKFLEKHQLKHFLQIVRFRGRPQEHNLFTLLAFTGLRIGELLALKWSDIDNKQRVISVTKTLVNRSKNGVYLLGPPKNKSSIRKVTIGDTAVLAFESQKDWQDQYKRDHELFCDDNFVFWTLKYPGCPADAGRLLNRMKVLLDLAKLPVTLTLHSLRHTHVSLLAEAGVELPVIQERIGHKNDEITRRIYLHVTKGQRTAAPDRFEKVMQS
ncbi:tyrosine-type recombinase/integrase [Paenibacillus sp. GYB004]|uniref:tyrosine-type recombinase/integrase n=1 Tax=Paenibacillus sp. GYB004 TaxID=2994393 RepID=UPI002F96917C